MRVGVGSGPVHLRRPAGATGSRPTMPPMCALRNMSRLTGDGPETTAQRDMISENVTSQRTASSSAVVASALLTITEAPT